MKSLSASCYFLWKEISAEHPEASMAALYHTQDHTKCVAQPVPGFPTLDSANLLVQHHTKAERLYWKEGVHKNSQYISPLKLTCVPHSTFLLFQNLDSKASHHGTSMSEDFCLYDKVLGLSLSCMFLFLFFKAAEINICYSLMLAI